jgi:protease-4
MNSKGQGFFKTLYVFGFVLLFTVVAALVLGSIYGGETGNVALIKIEGEITTSGDILSAGVTSDEIVNAVEDADANPDVQAIVFGINSPGGTIVATKEIVNAVKNAKKPTVCWLRESAASGAYWVASACDKIIADEFTMTGSLGVTGSYLEFSGLFEKYGVGYVRIVSGGEKDIGTPFREPTAAEKAELQAMIDEIHNAFIEDVAKNRNISVERVRQIANGSVFLGNKALALGLIDNLGGKQEAFDIAKELANITEVKVLEYKKEVSLSQLASMFFGDSLAKYFVSQNMKFQV